MGGFVRHGQEVVPGGGGQVQDFTTSHHIIVHVDRVDGVGHEDGVILAEQVQQVAQVALGAVRDEDLGHIQRYTALGVVLPDGLAQERIALLAGDVAVEGLLAALLLDGLVHGLGDRSGQRQGDVTDPQADDIGLRVGFLVISDFMGDGAEEIALVQLGIMRIELHVSPPL